MKKVAIGCTIFLVVLVLFVMFVLPPLVKSKAVEAIKESTGRNSQIGSISINPFTLTATIENFQLLEASRPPLFSVSRIRASVSPSSIFRKALIVDEVSVDKPAFNFSRYAANKYSFSDIIELQKKLPKKKEEKKEKFLFSINNITLHGGSVDFDDAAVSRKHTIRDLEIGVPFVSNIPYRVEKYVQPKISAVVNGTPFNFGGQLKPFSKSLETSVHLSFNRLSLPRYLAYSPVPPPVNVPSGNLSLDTELSYRVSSRDVPDLALRGTFRLDDVAINLKDGRPLLKAPLAEVKATKLEVLANRFDIASIRLDGIEVFASRDRQGRWMFEQLRTAEAKKEKEPEKEKDKDKEKKKEAHPLWMHIGSAELANGAFHFADALPQGGFASTVSNINIGLKNFGTDPKSLADYQISLLLNKETGVDSAGRLSVAPASLNGKAGIKNFNLRQTWPYLAAYLTNPVEGKLDLSSDISYSKEKGFVSTHGQAALRKLSLKYGAGEGMKLGELLVKDAGYDQNANRLTIADVGLANGATSLSLEPGGVSILSLLKKEKPAASAGAGRKPHPKPEKKEAHGKKGAPFSYKVGTVHARALNFSFTDKTREEHPQFTLNDTGFNLTNIQGPRFAPIGLRFKTRLGNRGPIAANGQLVPQPFSYSGTVALKSIALRQFEDYLPDNLNVILAGGDLDVALKTDLALKDGKIAGTFAGSAGVRSFHILDSVDEQDLLKWESLEVEDVRGTLAPFSLAVREVSLSNVYSKIVVRPDGTLNLQNLVEPPEAPAAAAASAKQPGAAAPPAPAKPAQPPVAVAKSVPPASPAASQAAAQKRVSIGTVVVQGGTLAFSDLHLSKPFNTTFYNLGGRVSGLSSESSTVADVDLRGNLENRSPLQITGKINPLRGDLFVDLKMSFRDIEMPAATPYSGTYLGYTIDQGKLFLDLKYLIEKNKLTSENKVFLDQFTFGQKVESKKATSLPVRLAVALLKDRNGEIHLDLPVTGRTDDPQFKVWGVVWQVLKNLVVKAATSPFSLLSSMVGKDQDLRTVAFDPGSSRLSAAESDKLKALGKALTERPGIVLEVGGYVNKEKDAEGYRHEQLQKKLRTEKFLQMVKKNKETAGISADNLEISKEEYPDLLRAVYVKEKFPKPRTILGTVKDLPVEEMTKLIYANMIVGDHELHALAHDRCATVISYLAKEAKVPQERMFEKSGDIYTAPKEGGPRGRVEFVVSAK
ncbi:DUF748 domain-containing protein [Geomesophilobacter sediminis]|nr:DUF748 domain-containing protein [Geomesophilobacter sediminis]